MLQEVVADQVHERLVAEDPAGVGDVLRHGVDQPVEVHPRVDLHALAGVQGRAARDLVQEILVPSGHGAGDAPVQQRLQLGQPHRASSSTARSSSRARSASARTSSRGGMWSSHSTSELTRPKRRTASR